MAPSAGGGGAGQSCMARKGWTLGWARSGQGGTAVQGALGIGRIQTRWAAGRQDLGGGFSVRGSLWGRWQGTLRSEVRAGVHAGARRLWLGLPTAGQGPSVPALRSPPMSVGIWAFLWCLWAWTPSCVPACVYVCVSDPVCVFSGVGVPASLGVCTHVCLGPFVHSWACVRACIPVRVCQSVCVPMCTVSVGL